MKVLHTADLHLREYGDQSWRALRTLIEVGRKEKIDLFAVCGDLFDRGVDAEKLREPIRELFSGNGFQILIIPGNHDADSYGAGMYFGSDARILHDIAAPVEFDDARIFGIPFEPLDAGRVLDRLRSLAGNLKGDRKNVLLFHGELLDAFFSRKDFGEEGDRRYMPLKLSYFDGLKIDYVLAGHFHSNFDVRTLKSGGYFVYPGSPVSITRRETGRRKANVFQIGEPPGEYALDTPHFEEVTVTLDPFEGLDPIEAVTERFAALHPQAKVILTVRGFVNGAALGTTETELVSHIKRMAAHRVVEEHYEFKDIARIIEDDLFRSFKEKLYHADYPEEKRREMCNLAIRAMMEART